MKRHIQSIARSAMNTNPMKSFPARVTRHISAKPVLPFPRRQEQLEMRFPSRQEQEDFEDDSEFFLDEDDITE